MKSRIQFILRILILCLIFFTFSLSAHQRSESYSKWTISQFQENFLVNVIFTIRLSNLIKLEGPLTNKWEERVSTYIISSFTTQSDCFQRGKYRVSTSRKDDFVKISWTYSCKTYLQHIKNNVFFDKNRTHSHIARVISESGLSTEKLFTSQARNWTLEDAQSTPQDSKSTSFKEYVLLGVQHISTGYDHLAFLLGLLLLNQRFKSLLLAITGFTLGHSLTLSLAVLNYVRPLSNFIEALIGFSIILVGLEFIIRSSNRSLIYIKTLFCIFLLFTLLYFFTSDGRYILGLLGLFLFTICYLILAKENSSNFLSPFMASIFGLIHGFGFGGFLFEVGFSEPNLLKALFGFNVGVELGQLTGMCLFILVGWGIYKLNFKKQHYVNSIFASLLVTLGTYWFFSRII